MDRTAFEDLFQQGDIRMRQLRGTFSGALRSFVLIALFAGFSAVQSQSAKAVAQKIEATIPVTTERDLADTQDELFRLLRLSPTLTEVVQRDPSLLSNQEYVSRTNPGLAQFLQSHPEVARNPDFYLFSGLNVKGGRQRQAFERKVWPEFGNARDDEPVLREFVHDFVPFLVFVCLLSALLWLIHVFLENRRWARVFQLQKDAHGKLIDRFGSNQELLVYMGTEAGKRFLEAAPIPVDFERDQRVPSAVARVLTPLQIGVVLTLLGIGLLALRYSLVEIASPLLVVGVVVLMPGIGFIISAGITWMLAGRLGLMPDKAPMRTAHDDLRDGQ
jgi:hypothetical protein